MTPEQVTVEPDEVTWAVRNPEIQLKYGGLVVTLHNRKVLGAGRAGSSWPVERTSTKTRHVPSRATRSNSPRGQA